MNDTPEPPPDERASPPSRRPRLRTGPLAGVRVTDFCWMGVGALATRLLADFGAEVIRIEDRNRLDMPRRLPIYKGEPPRAYGNEDPNPDPNKGGLFNNYNRNKLGVTIDMRTPEGRDVAERLIRVSDAVTENFAPGVMERWGLTEDHVRALNPDVVYARMSGYGHSGPHAHYRSYGPVVQAVSGLSHISGLPGEQPSGWGLSYMDNQAAYYNAVGLLLALYARGRTGTGTDVDVSAIEAGVELLGPILLDASVNGRTTRGEDFPLGNRLEHPAAAPHGVYPCAGDDRWVAIAVLDDDEWAALVGVLGSPDWAHDERFETAESRAKHQDDLDAHLAEWTGPLDRHEVMHRLQAAGVRAGAVQDARDLAETDPQIAAHGTFFTMDHPVIGEALFEGTPFLTDRIREDRWRSAPLLGEDNAYVCHEILGMDDDEYARLADAGVI
jgi:crotonobetainyl-CoA:carnitine CoA-transferase CaiB-like acyl-CoA transferase